MKNYEMSTQKIPDLHVCSLDEIESKITNTKKREFHFYSTYERESKRVIVDVCYLDDSESKRVHISVNTREGKDAMNETKDE